MNADPILAKQLESLGCATVMPLDSPIGSGQGLKNKSNIQINGNYEKIKNDEIVVILNKTPEIWDIIVNYFKK